MAPMGMVKPRVSYADLERRPEDGRRYELYDGEVFVVPSPILRHQIIVQRLWRILDDHARLIGGLAVVSPIDVVFSQFDVVQPDIVFIGAARLKGVSLDSRIQEVPDLAIEVLSSSTAPNDRGRKMRMFHHYGVPEYWIVDPAAETIEIYSLGSSGYSLSAIVSGTGQAASEIAPGFSFTAATIFPNQSR
jgi:Uma2 family endonuclease